MTECATRTQKGMNFEGRDGKITIEQNHDQLGCRFCACARCQGNVASHIPTNAIRGGRHLLVAKIDRKSRIKMEMCSRLRSEVRLPQFIWIQACSISWETVARSAGSFFKQQATKSHISALAPQPAGKEGGSSLTILFMISQ